jgi:predicted GIY-YIG superfamily endonuclease
MATDLDKKLLIRSVGLYWQAGNVHWGAGSQAGALYGVPARNVSADPIDFREQVGIYVLYAGYQMVYVGQTGSKNSFLLERLKQHRKDDLAERWDRFSWFGLRWVKQNGDLSAVVEAHHPSTSRTLNHIEAILIHAAEPPLNRQGGRFGDDVTRYVQSRDERLGSPDRELLIAIHDAVTPKKPR